VLASLATVNRVVVFGEDQLSGEFMVGEDGFVNLPSLGAIPAAGQTITDFQNTLVSRYTIYVTDPKVTVSVLNSQ
jgi:polysaccharide export outer membrane protein